MFLISPDPSRTFTTGVFSFCVNQLRDYIEFSASVAGVAHSGRADRRDTRAPFCAGRSGQVLNQRAMLTRLSAK